jgi:hypothetical protein
VGLPSCIASIAPEQSDAARFAATQKEMGGDDRAALDARQAEYAASQTQAAEGRRAALEKDIAERGKYGEAKETRLAAREAGLGKEKDQMSGLALIEAGLGIMSTPGTLAMAIGKGAKEGLKSYGEGLAKLKAAQERIDDARDQMDEFRRTESNMTAKERREATNDISRTQMDIKKQAMDAAEKMYGYKQDETKSVFNAGTQQKITGQEIAGRRDVANIQSAATRAAAGAGQREQQAFMERLGASPEGSNLRKGFEMTKQESSIPRMYTAYTTAISDPMKGEAFQAKYPTFETFMAGMGGGGGGGGGAGQIYSDKAVPAGALRGR